MFLRNHILILPISFSARLTVYWVKKQHCKHEFTIGTQTNILTVAFQDAQNVSCGDLVPRKTGTAKKLAFQEIAKCAW